MDISMLVGLWENATQAQLLAPKLVLVLVGFFCLIYGISYFARSFKLSKQLKALTNKVQIVKNISPSKQREELGNIFKGHRLENIWREYDETLHNQYELQKGVKKLVRTRATVSSANFFTAQNIVETPLGTEFYKHLPGILTGIGIIGMFLGLMLGLSGFKTDDPQTMNNSVQSLLLDVFFAFVGSFASILASIIVTLTEKWRLSRCYKHLEALTENIDGLFESGVGEEYLAELVKSSSESSIQTRQLKDSLVTDLREMLQNLVDTQVRETHKLADSLSNSYRESGQSLAEQIGGSIENSLKGPLQQIAGVVQTASVSQSSQVQGLLTDVLTAFMSKLETTFGMQFQGLHKMLGESITAMQSMQQGFNSLVANMRLTSEVSTQNNTKIISQLLSDMQNGQKLMQEGMNEMLANLQASIARIGSEGEGAGERMALQLEKLFAESEERHKAMTKGLEDFVLSMQKSMGQGQQEAMSKNTETVRLLGEQLEGLFKNLAQNRAQMDQVNKVTQVELHRSTRDLIVGLEKQVEDLLKAVTSQNDAMQDTINRLSKQTDQHLQNMIGGAEKMRLAADHFNTAGQNVTKASEATVGLMGVIQGTSSDLVAASREVSSIVSDYRNNREAANNTLAVLEAAVARVQNEALGRNEYLEGLKQQSTRLQEVNREANEYLDKISGVLGRGFNEFTEGVDRSLRQTLGELDVELHKAITSLAGGVDTVKESLDDFSDILDRVQRK